MFAHGSREIMVFWPYAWPSEVLAFVSGVVDLYLEAFSRSFCSVGPKPLDFIGFTAFHMVSWLHEPFLTYLLGHKVHKPS